MNGECEPFVAENFSAISERRSSECLAHTEETAGQDNRVDRMPVRCEHDLDQLPQQRNPPDVIAGVFMELYFSKVKSDQKAPDKFRKGGRPVSSYWKDIYEAVIRSMLSGGSLLKKGEVSELANAVYRNLDKEKYPDEKVPEATTIAGNLNRLFK